MDTNENIFFDRFGKPHVKPDHAKVYKRKSVCGIAIKKEEIFLIKPPDNPFWEFPGGKIEPGETVEVGLEREFLEETGFAINKIGKKIGCKKHLFYSLEHDVYNDSMVSFLLVSFDESVRHKDKMTPEETEEARWFKLKEIEIEKINPFHRSVIEKLREGC